MIPMRRIPATVVMFACLLLGQDLAQTMLGLAPTSGPRDEWRLALILSSRTPDTGPRQPVLSLELPSHHVLNLFLEWLPAGASLRALP